MPALYLALGVMTAIKRANQGFAHKIEPWVRCSYDVASDDIADLRTHEGRAEQRVSLEDVACPWFSLLAQGKEPPSWDIARRLHEEGNAGILVPSFAPGAVCRH